MDEAQAVHFTEDAVVFGGVWLRLQLAKHFLDSRGCHIQMLKKLKTLMEESAHLVAEPELRPVVLEMVEVYEKITMTIHTGDGEEMSQLAYERSGGIL